jgi:peptidoglycan/LPS O-acetylase OafA/YrhL
VPGQTSSAQGEAAVPPRTPIREGEVEGPVEMGRSMAAPGRNVALDGVRGVGILVVMAYHSQLGWASGGLMMIETFFVLSGFLITGLLVREWGRSGTIRLRRFWARRARRLLPALLLLLVGVALFAWLIAPGERPAIRSNSLYTMLYAANWHQIATGQSYFALSAQPSPLLHTWTLAIEEQFYLVWPIIVLAVLHFTRRLRPLLVIALALAVASAVWMAILYQPGVDPSRLYYGTDTRAQGVLVGSALAIALAMRPQKFSDRGRRLVAVLAVLAIAGITAEWFVFLSNPGWIYQGGFLVSDGLFAALFLGLVQAPRTGVAKVLSWRPLVYIGTISYSLYLWHWPVDLWLNTARTGLSGWQLFGVRSLVAGVIAASSTHWIENPIRLGTFRPWKNWTWTLTPAAVLATAGFVFLATIVPSAREPVSATVAGTSSHGINGPSPIKFLMVGDSQAKTLGTGLAVDARTVGVQFENHGQDGCDLDEDIHSRFPFKLRGNGGQLDGSVSSVCTHWQSYWAGLVKTERPSVVGILMGRGDVYDHYWNGHWVHVGETAWDDHLIYGMNLAIKILSSRGAHVILFTTPYDSPTAGGDTNGITFPENEPGRVDAYNTLVRKVASEHPGTVTVFDLNKEFTVTKDVYTPTIDGYTVRNPDGVHFLPAAGELAGRKLFPLVDKLALEGH